MGCRCTYLRTYLFARSSKNSHKYLSTYFEAHSFLRSADNGQTMEWKFELKLVQFYFDPSSLMISFRLFLDISFGHYKHEKGVFQKYYRVVVAVFFLRMTISLILVPRIYYLAKILNADWLNLISQNRWQNTISILEKQRREVIMPLDFT